MGRSIFISYKYNDNSVYGYNITARDYVDKLQRQIEYTNHVNKGEDDHTDLSRLSDDQIRQKLADRMFYSSVTIVLISPEMQDHRKSERNQWIPWEIRYSLRTEHRETGNSYRNAILAVILPDRDNSYEYAIERNACGCQGFNDDVVFPIMMNNMYNNIETPQVGGCGAHKRHNETDHSYIVVVNWNVFVTNISTYITQATDRQDKQRANPNYYEIDTTLDG